MDPWECYERAVQSAEDSLRLVLDEHGGAPLTLAEHFAGSAALARAFVASRAERRAVAIDLDSHALSRARGIARLQTLIGDVREARHAPVDIVHAGNFSLGYLHTRRELVDYLRGVRASLAPGGLFACDTYGGASAFCVGSSTRRIKLGDGVELTSLWERRAADLRTARVENVLGFRVTRRGDQLAHWPEAFVYRWRLWSLPELCDALDECGFSAPRVRTSTSPERAEDPPLGVDWAVMLCASIEEAVPRPPLP